MQMYPILKITRSPCSFIGCGKSSILPLVKEIFHCDSLVGKALDATSFLTSKETILVGKKNDRTNISLSATTNGELDLRSEKEEEEVVKYVPPHPAQGSGIHRYTVMIFEQPGPVALSGHQDLLERAGFSLRRFSSQLDLKPAGVMAWISQWHQRDADTISAIYRDELRESPFPLFSAPPHRSDL
jgi:hypothetical protein